MFNISRFTENKRVANSRNHGTCEPSTDAKANTSRSFITGKMYKTKVERRKPERGEQERGEQES